MKLSTGSASVLLTMLTTKLAVVAPAAKVSVWVLCT